MPRMTLREFWLPQLSLSRWRKQRLAKLIIRCFKGVDWTRNGFQAGGQQIKDKFGNEYFYACKSIDKAIEKLNRLIKRLTK